MPINVSDNVAFTATGLCFVDAGANVHPAHLRAALTAVQLAIPVTGGRLALGTWQGIYLWEHRRRPHRREVALHLIGR